MQCAYLPNLRRLILKDEEPRDSSREGLKSNCENRFFPRFLAGVTVGTHQAVPQNLPFEVQISGDSRNFGWSGDLAQFGSYLCQLESKFGVSKWFLAPLFHDSLFWLGAADTLGVSFGWALHYSLVEREFQEEVLNRAQERSEEVLALRSFGGLGFFGNWYLPYNPEDKPEETLETQKDLLEQTLANLSMSEQEARLTHAFANPAIDLAAISLGNEARLDEALTVIEQVDPLTYPQDLDAVSKSANLRRLGLGFRYPANQSFWKGFGPSELVLAGIRSRNLRPALKFAALSAVRSIIRRNHALGVESG